MITRRIILKFCVIKFSVGAILLVLSSGKSAIAS